MLNDSGLPDPIEPNAWQHPVQDLPNETLVFLLGSRYCDTDRMTEIAWGRFDKAPSGGGRVQAICYFVHNHIVFGYEHARSTRTAMEAFQERRGVCRDYTHLAITFCRCMNIPALIAPTIPETSACRRPMRRAISRPGSRFFSEGAGIS